CAHYSNYGGFAYW
nr:immunoglobulin heavy chain junction region [Mus musculus]